MEITTVVSDGTKHGNEDATSSIEEDRPQTSDSQSQQPDIIPRLVAWTISGRDTEANGFPEKLRNSYWPHGDRSPPNLMTHCSHSGQAGVTNGVPIPFREI